MPQSRLQVVEAYRLDRYDNLVPFRTTLTLAVVEAYRLDRYDNPVRQVARIAALVVEAYRLDRYDNSSERADPDQPIRVVEAYRLDRYDNSLIGNDGHAGSSCRSLSFG